MRLVRPLAITNADISGVQFAKNQFLKVPTCKTLTNSELRDKGRKLDFPHIVMVDRLGHDKNYWIVFLAAKYSFISKKNAKYKFR